MKTSTLRTNSIFTLGCITLFIFLSGCVQMNPANNHERKKKDMYDGPELAARQEFERTKDPATGRVPRERLLTAIQQTIDSKNEYSSAIGGLAWNERGPISDLPGVSNGNTRANNDFASGRVRAILVDKSDATGKTVIIGGVNGGLWKTTDITAQTVSWALINDNLSNLAISDITQDPRAGFQNIMYFCTGESYFNADAVQGNGVFKSIDYGATWTYLPSTSTYVFGTRILCDYLGNIYLATRGTGLLRSTVASGGAAWTNITPSTFFNFPLSDICDLEISSTTVAGRLHVVAGIFTTQAYRYTDAPTTVAAATWTAPTTAFPSFAMRAEICVSGSTLYSLVANATYQVPIIYKSIDGGANWAACATSPASGWASGQGWYNLACDIDPSSGGLTCIVGALDTWKTTNGGTTWTQVSSWVGVTPIPQYVHADVHKILWYDGGNKLLFGSDGGIFFSTDKGSIIKDRNKGIRIKQFYSCAIHPTTTNYFLAGAQDNGTHQFSSAGLSSTVEVTGGDGAFVAIDQDFGSNQFGAYVFNTYRRSINDGSTWSSVNFYKGTSGSASNFGNFINAFDFDNTSNIIYAGADGGEFFRWTSALTTTAGNYFNTTGFPAGAAILTGITGFSGSKVTAVTVSPYTSNRVYFGTAGGRVVYIDGANTAPSSTAGTNITGASFPAGTVSCINTGTNDLNLIACFSNYGVSNIWVTSDGGVSWTAIDGTLPNMPVRWCMFYPGDNTKAYIATETGVWETDLISGGATVWNANPSFPTMRTDMIKYRSSDRTIAAATHGRGLWTAIIPSVATPDLSFQTATTSETESTTFTSSCRGYTDYTKYMVIANSPTGTGTVTLGIAGGATATSGVDYAITTNGNFAAPGMTLSFADGATAPQPFTIRVYNDDAVESAETFTINYTVAGGNAVPGVSNQTLAFTINDNDAAPVSSSTLSAGVGTAAVGITSQSPFRGAQARFRLQNLWTASELIAAGFTSARNFTSMTLYVSTKSSILPYTGFTISMGNTSVTSLGGYTGPAFTTVYPATLYPTVFGANLFTFTTPFAWDGVSNIVIEYCWNNAAAGLSDVLEGNSAPLGSGVLATAYYTTNASPPCTALAGFASEVRVRATFGTAVVSTPVSTALSSTKTAYLGPSDDVYFYDGSGNIMARIKNLTAFDYGCTEVNIDRAGSTSAQFWNVTAANNLLSKSIKVVPTNNTSSGTYEITLYYTAAEVAGWEAATGRTWAGSAMQVVKVSNGFFIPDVTAAVPHSADVSMVTGSKGTLGTNYTIRGDFTSTGFSGFGVGVPGNAILTSDFRTKASGDFTDGTKWQYNNEGAGYVDALQAPSSNSNVNIQAAHTIALDAGFVINTGKTVTVNGTLNCGTNTISGAGSFALDAAGTLGIGSAVGITSSGATGNIQTTGRSFLTTSNYTYNGALNQATGSGLPATINNLVINNTGSASNNIVTMGSALLVSGTTALTAGILSLGANTLTLTGVVSGSGTFTGSSTSNMVIAGAAGTLNFTAGSRSLSDLTLTSGSAALGTALDIYGVLTVTAGTLNLAAQSVTLKSTGNGAAATARVAPVLGTLSGASNVTAERYINNPTRAWHLLSAKAVTGSQTIRDSWQESGTVAANKGTWITSPGSTLPGFDATSVNGASILIHDQATPSWTTIAVAATNAAPSLSAQQGYMLFVRGDRTCTHLNATVTPTVLKANGTLTQGLVNVTVATGTGNTLVGNPYASPINMEGILAPGGIPVTNLDMSYMVWDPALAGNYGVGGFRAVVRTGLNAYNQTPVVAGGTVVGDATIQFIHSGSALFMHATGGSATVAFNEVNKSATTTTVYNPIVGIAGDQQILANLMVVQPGNIESLADGIRVMYNDAYSATATDDIIKMGNFTENLSSYRDGKKLIVERRPMIVSKDTIFLRMTNTIIKNYRFQVFTVDFVQTNALAYLQDTYLNTVTSLNLTGNVTNIDFTVTADPASANPDRFRIIFAAAGPLPSTITTVKAAQLGSDITVEWKVTNQLNIQKYEVEKSTDGVNFTKVNTQQATGIPGADITYNWLDMNPAPGDNFYRIRSIGFAGDVKISQAVKVSLVMAVPAISIYPNPVINRTVNIQFTGMEKGLYRLRLVNMRGQVVFTQTLHHTGGNSTQTIKLGAIAKGNYRLEFIKPDNTKTVKALVITE